MNNVLWLTPKRLVRFESNVYLERARLDLERCEVKAYFDRRTGKFIDLEVWAYGSDYTEYLNRGQYLDLQSEAEYHAETLH